MLRDDRRTTLRNAVPLCGGGVGGRLPGGFDINMSADQAT
jgi:hypothetical protein